MWMNDKGRPFPSCSSACEFTGASGWLLLLKNRMQDWMGPRSNPALIAVICSECVDELVLNKGTIESEVFAEERLQSSGCLWVTGVTSLTSG